MKVLLKPGESMLRNLFKRAGLFEKMRGTGHDDKTFRAGKQSVGCSIHLDDGPVVSTDNQESRRGDRREIGFGQIRSAAP
jgi:hypothetical protein